MSAFIDEPGTEYQAELGLVICGAFEDQDTAVEKIAELQIAISLLLKSDFPTMRIETANALHGEMENGRKDS